MRPNYDADGLVTCVTTRRRYRRGADGRAYERGGIARTIETGEAWYYSRSRGALWRKGESSGNIQWVLEMRVDCDQDAVWIKVEQAGAAACHTGRRSCFYRAVPLGQTGALALEFRDADGAFDPAKVYGKREDLTLIDPERRSRAIDCCARTRCGRSYITPPMPTTPAPRRPQRHRRPLAPGRSRRLSA